MTLVVAIAAAFAFGVLAANAVSVRRYSPRHVVAQVALRGRGLFFQRTPDGIWWRLRLRPRRRRCLAGGDEQWGDGPPGGGVREPRRPVGGGPLAGGVRLQPPSG